MNFLENCLVMKPYLKLMKNGCWCKAQILPEIPAASCTIQPSISIANLVHNANLQMDPVIHAEKQVESALDDLVFRGTLQKRNRMDIESLLNSPNESHTEAKASDEDIYEAVMDAIDSTHDNVDKNGGDDDVV